jgi:flavodoxin
MKHALVVFASRTGYTRQIAEEIARRIGADVEEIRESTRRSGWFGYWRCAREALRRTAVQINPPLLRPRDYRVVVLGTPVWAGNVSSPMRAYIALNREQLPQVAFYCTQGRSGANKVLQDMAAACASEPVATAAFDDREIDSGSYSRKMNEFVDAIAQRNGAAGPVDRSAVATKDPPARLSMRD